MTSALSMDASRDQTDLPTVLRGGLKLGLLYSLLVAIFGVLQVRLEGPVELVVCGIIFLIGISALIVLPGLWTRARTIEGIAGAAGIGLGGAVVFLLIDVVLLQKIGTYSNRWRAIGGGSNWWYHPVWWMVGAYLPWMGAFILSNQAARGGASVGKAAGLVAVLALVFGALGVILHVPHAGWNLGTFAVAVLPALATATAISGLGSRRS